MASSSVDPWDDWESDNYARGGSSSSSTSNGATSANARLWQIANSSLSMDVSSNGNLPPPQAYTPSLKILKRPTSAASSHSNSSVNNAAAQAKTLKDRERAYQEARKKIFGEEESVPTEIPARSNAASPAPLPQIGLQAGPAAQDIPPAGGSNKTASRNSNSTSKKKKNSNKSTPNASRPSTPSFQPEASASTGGVRELTARERAANNAPGLSILREPINPPSNSSQGPALGFTNTRAQQQKAKKEKEKAAVVLSPAAQAFVPRGLVPSKVADKQRTATPAVQMYLKPSEGNGHSSALESGMAGIGL